MSLTNSQYESIMQKYDKTRMSNRLILDERKEFVFNTIPLYKELDDETITLSLEIFKSKMANDSSLTKTLKDKLDAIKEKKKQLLIDNNLGADYLNDIYNCPDCKDTGYIERQKCHCFIKEETDLLYDQSNIREFLNLNNFSTLSHDYHKGDDFIHFTKAEQVCHNMVDTFADTKVNLLLFGTVGTGKSFLSGCVAYELIQKGYSVIYYSSAALFDALAKEAFSRSKEDLNNLYDCIYNCDLLIIDDLGTELTNSFVASQLFSCINERSLRNRSTIISTNLSLEEIRDRYSDRVFSRIIAGYQILKITGPDIRTIKKQQTANGK